MKKFVTLFIAIVLMLTAVACVSEKDYSEKSCWNCGEPISETASFCASCGSALADSPIKTEPSTSATEESGAGTVNTDSTIETTVPLSSTPTTTPPTTTPPTTPTATTPPTTEAPHTHSYNSKVTTAATCGMSGITTFTCSCGDSYTENIAATGQHSWQPATCTDPKKCTACNKIEGSANGHSWGNWVTIAEAEVGKAGQEKRTCSSCSQSETRDIPALQEDTTKKWFVAQYTLAKQQYINSLEKSKSSKQDDIVDLKAKIDDETDKYNQKRVDILNKYPPSETRNIMLTTAQQNYAGAIKPYKDKISTLESEIATIDAEMANPNVDSILAIVTKNCNISSRETYEYYYKYSDSLS